MKKVQASHDFGPVKSAHHPLALTEDNMTHDKLPGFDELLSLLPANDNGGRQRKLAPTPSCPHTLERVNRMLAVAGYDPNYIPYKRRLAALQVAWCLEKGIFDEREIARFVGGTRADVRSVARLLEQAAGAQRTGVMAQALRAAGIGRVA